MDRRKKYIASREDEALISRAEDTARRQGTGTSNAGSRSSLLRQLAEALGHYGQTLGALDDKSLRRWSGELLPENNKVLAALRQLEEHREVERAKNNRQAGEGSSHQAAPFSMEGFDQGDVWAGVDQGGQAPTGSFNQDEFWAGVDQAGQAPAGSVNSANFWQGAPLPPSPAQSVNQSSPPMSDQGGRVAGIRFCTR
ncbi:hypothetical protein [Rhizobium leguminosarum]|uniref:hypothetical protein n=1 Tax=Rhizobium leguminosarum TaxID=384 RepID=UPI001249D718|nr:hypothetical protein [Rhizobium leguminosarum]